MNIVERAGQFVQGLKKIMRLRAEGWKQCPRCGSYHTIRHGTYARHPWGIRGRLTIRVQRHKCHQCQHTYAEQTIWLAPRSWYTRAVHRMAIDGWMHGRSSLRRVAEFVRSMIGRQERWWIWHSLLEEELGEKAEEKSCYLSASTVQRWLDRAGNVAQASIAGQLRGIRCAGEMGTDGLWARLRGGVKRVGLLLVDYTSGLVHPPVVVEDEAQASHWGQLFQRAQAAGLWLADLNGITSDGSQGLLSYLRTELSGVHQQRCVWHVWRSVSRQVRQQIKMAVQGLDDQAAKERRRQLRRELSGMLHAFFDATSYECAEEALAELAAHICGQALATGLEKLQDALLMHLMQNHTGLTRVGPEWYWRDFRQRLSGGRNHGSQQRLERALLSWAIYRNFTPVQRRSEQKRHYRHPGQSPLEVAGAPPGSLSYLDALGV